MSADEQALLIAGVAYLLALAIWAFSLQVRARVMLDTVGKLMDPELWQALGAPDSLKAAMQDPQRRWLRFIRSGAYRRECDDVVIALIDDHRRRTRWMLGVCAVGGILLVIRFWPLLRPDFA